MNEQPVRIVTGRQSAIGAALAAAAQVGERNHNAELTAADKQREDDRLLLQYQTAKSTRRRIQKRTEREHEKMLGRRLTKAERKAIARSARRFAEQNGL